MKKRSIIAAAGIALSFSLVVAGCAQTDVVAKVANTSFKAVAAAAAEKVTWSEEEGSWILASAVGDKLELAADFSRNAGAGGMADMDKPDVEFVFDAAPFLAAGLDPAKLAGPEGMIYEIEEGELMLHFELGNDAFPADSKKTITATFAEIVRTQRSRVGYHEALDHYGIALGGGNMFEWAKDLAKNDKDIVWVLNPEPFIAAGVDPAKVEGWAFAKVEMKEGGKTVLVDKLLKPFDLK